MDRIDTIAAFVAVAEEGSFVAAADKLRRSPAAVTRAVAALEDRLSLRLFNRTTRAVMLTDDGSRYLDLCRRLLAEVDELELSAANEKLEPRGVLTVTAPEMFGRLHILPLVHEFMRDHPQVEVSLLLLNRIISFVDEGVDVGVRIAHLPDSALRAIQVGTVRRVVCASPGYLAAHGMPKRPQDLAQHAAIGISGTRPVFDQWSFGGLDPVTVKVRQRLVVNTIEAGIEAAILGAGVVRLLSYQTVAAEHDGRLMRLLRDAEPEPTPIHIVYPAGRYLSPKVRLFIDRAVSTLRRQFGE
jgi:DNA-binding transcriptional LysR family regulator